VEADAGAYGFPSGIQGVLSTFVLTLVPEYEQVIAQSAHALASGGRLVIADFKRPDDWASWLVRLGVRITKPIGVALDLTDWKPWQVMAKYLPRVTDITLEIGENPEPTARSCGGNATRTVQGFVYADGDGDVFYFAGWTQKYVGAGVAMAIGGGERGEGAGEERRRSVGLECRLGAGQVQFMAKDPDRSPWGRSKFVDSMLSREAALGGCDRNE
jgi:hypothetical protein